MTRAILTRTQTDNYQTLGELLVLRDELLIYKCVTLELPWKQNRPVISCIPKGKYKVVQRVSDKYKNHLHVCDVPNRTYILIHSGNYNIHTKGCILVGKEHVDINSDGLLDITYSKLALHDLLECFNDSFELTVTGVCG